MNCRKDIKEIIAFMKKNQLLDSENRINLAKLGREKGCDYRTIKKYLLSSTKPPESIEFKIKSKLDDLKNKILEKYDAGVPATGIFMLLKRNYNYKGSYSLITRYLRSENKKRLHQAIIRFETEPGRQAQVDWKESLKFITKSNKRIDFNIFIITLGFSRKKYICVTETRDQLTVFKCLTESFFYFGGIPREILFDNMRSITDKSRTTYSEVVYNDRFIEFTKEFGFKAMNCIAYRPNTKGKVESVARILNRLKAFSGEIESFEDIIRIVREFNEEINNEIHQGTKRRPNELFKKEKEHLLPLGNYYQDRVGEFIEPVNRRIVSKESLYSYRGHKYSVSPKYIGKHVFIINDNGESFDVIDKTGHFIKNQKISEKPINYSPGDYLEIAQNSSIKSWSKENIEKHCKEVLSIYDKL